jgi:glutathione S-transferase
MTITLWGRPTSVNVQKVRWTLAELGLAYEHILLGGRHGGNREPAYLATNPNGLVPTLRDGDLVVWESQAVVRYLAARYGAGSLWPEDVVARAIVDQWADWAATTFQPAWIGVFSAVVRTLPRQHDAARIGHAVAAVEQCLAIMDGRLARVPWLGGEALTYADIVAGAGMFRWTTMEIARQEHPHVAAWHRRLRGRAAFRDTVEIDYGELFAREGA